MSDETVRIETALQRVPYDPGWIADEGEPAIAALRALAARLEAAETALREVCDYGDRAAVTIARAALAAGRGEHG